MQISAPITLEAVPREHLGHTEVPDTEDAVPAEHGEHKVEPVVDA